MSAYSTHTETCPWCKTEGCEADWVDVGIGLVQCGPFVCPNCEATSIGSYDSTKVTEEEKEAGWYKPGKIGDKTNTFQGKPIDHKTALDLYIAGLLDEKKTRSLKMTDKPAPRLDLMPSAADRWTTCMASPRFCLENAELLPKDTSSRFSKEGNTAHEIAAAYLQNRELDPANCPTPVNEDMRWHGWGYMEYVEGLRAEGAGLSKLLVEQKMPLWYYPDRNAVVDAAVLNPGNLHIVDYKYGEGIIISPEANKQMTIYARSIVESLKLDLPDDFPATLHIYQPRSRTAGDTPYHVWETTWEEIKRLSDEIADYAQVIQINNRVQGTSLDFVASEKACQWCPAKGFCTERQKQLLDGIEVLEVIEEKPKSLPLAAALTPQQIALVLKNKSQIEKWLKDVEGYAEEQMSAGKNIPGYKMVLSRGGNRYWLDPIKAAELLTKNTILKRSELVEEKIIGPAAVEKLLGKNKFPADVMALIGKPAGNPVIATEDDPRDPYLLRAEDEFEVISPAD